VAARRAVVTGRLGSDQDDGGRAGVALFAGVAFVAEAALMQSIVIGLQKLELQNELVVIVRQTRYVPLAVKVFGVLAMLPSPKSQLQATMTPDVLVEKSVKLTVGQLVSSAVKAGRHWAPAA